MRSKYFRLTWLLPLLILLQVVILLWGVPQLENAASTRFANFGDWQAIFFALISLAFPLALVRMNFRARGGGSWPMVFSASVLVVATIGAFILAAGEKPTKLFSDMLPIMEVMAGRMLEGADPYAPISEIWDGVKPIYLPGFWLPFTIPAALGLDVRWVIYLVFFGALLLVVYRFRSNGWQLAWSFFPIAVLLGGCFLTYPAMLTQIPEFLIVGYYLLLGLALLSRKILPIALMLSLCLLSRYIVLPWLPILAIHLYRVGGIGRLTRTVLLTAAISTLMMYFSGALDQLTFLREIPATYYRDIGDPAKAATYSHLIFDYLGLVRFFYPAKLALLQTLFYLGMFGGAFLGYWLSLRNGLSSELGSLVALLLVLAVFFNLLIGPYVYLFFMLPLMAFLVYNARLSEAIVSDPTADNGRRKIPV